MVYQFKTCKIFGLKKYLSMYLHLHHLKTLAELKPITYSKPIFLLLDQSLLSKTLGVNT